ncbi:TasA family protein [Virgibacillus oceani]|uniref:Cell division protein FtsN n=1 Tax=Virgibacillus oceani TaxID=1479511 RepID=A0A917H6X6_9BACI|nr:TasA family protein [Virgibacillus oceani]GGG69532.1 cell division protein FtsN [Virgibacillus oceani]
MGIKNKLGMGIASAALGVSLIGGGTFAYFNDTENTDNTFAAGTLDLALSTNEGGNLNFTVENIKPGDKMYRQVRLINEGSLSIKDVLLNADYEVKDVNGDNGDEDFASQIYVTVYDPQEPAGTPVIIDNVPLSEINDLVIDKDLNAGDREILTYQFIFRDTGESQNIYQGDVLDVTFKYEASQQDGELR